MKKSVSVICAGLFIVSLCGLMSASDMEYRASGQEKKLERLTKDLNLTQEQNEKVSVILKESSGKIAAERQRVYDTDKTIKTDTDKKVKEVLTPEQAKKYEMNPSMILKKASETPAQGMDRMAAELGLSGEQREKIIAIKKEAAERTRERTTKLIEATQPIMEEERTKIEALLTPEQLQKYEGNKPTYTKRRELADKMLTDELAQLLNLSIEQKEKISAIIKEDSNKIEVERKNMIRYIDSVIYKRRETGMQEVLTPEQYKALRTTFVKYSPESTKNRKIILNESDDEHMDRMEKELGLTKEQKEKVISIREETRRKEKVEIDRHLDSKKTVLAEEDVKIKQMLTPEQAQKYDANINELRKKSSKDALAAIKKIEAQQEPAH